MKIKSITLKDFKRFTHLEIREIPEDARLVLLIGPNGSGKSSLFDALNLWSNINVNPILDYHLKVGGDVNIDGFQIYKILQENIAIEFHNVQIQRDQSSSVFNKAFYIRTAYRYESDFVSASITRMGDPLISDPRPSILINEDRKVSGNYNRIASTVLKDSFNPDNQEKLVGDVAQRITRRVAKHFKNIFPDLDLIGLGDPAIEGTFLFKKDQSSGWKYKNLSAGEKAVFDIILDLCVKSDFFDDTVYCIDEPEIHMHVGMQKKLLVEMLKIIPASCQIYLSTHSIGIIKEAFDISARHGGVYILDFDENFDEAVSLDAKPPSREILRKAYATALDDLSSVLAPKQVIICEGNPSLSKTVKNKAFDAKCLNNIFKIELPDSLFVSIGSSSDITKDSPAIRVILSQIVAGTKIVSLIDRDDRNTTEVAELANQGVQVLSRRDLENYLWDDEIILKFFETMRKVDIWDQYKAMYLEVAHKAVMRGIMPDDVKSFSSEIYANVKRMIGAEGLGQNKEGFAIEHLSTLVSPDTNTYKQLKKDIFEGGVN